MDPITTAIVAALSEGVAGMATQATEVGKMMVKDTYDAIKKAIQKKFGDDSKVIKAVTELEKEPDFKPNRDALAGRIEQADAAADKDLLKLAEALMAALQKTTEGRSALSKYNVRIENSQVGIVGDNAHVEGGLHFGDKKKDG